MGGSGIGTFVSGDAAGGGGGDGEGGGEEAPKPAPKPGGGIGGGGIGGGGGGGQLPPIDMRKLKKAVIPILVLAPGQVRTKLIPVGFRLLTDRASGSKLTQVYGSRYCLPPETSVRFA